MIPRQNFCSHGLTLLASHHRIVTHPICLYSPRYPRNEFLFALSLVLAPRTDATAYSLVAAKLAALLAQLELRTGLLSRDLAASTAKRKSDAQTNGINSKSKVSNSINNSNSTNHGHIISSASSASPIFGLCEILLEDLNNYGECMIPLLASRQRSSTLNLKLFPTYAPTPARLASHHVPLATARLDRLADPTWDATARLVLPRLDGVSSVADIARVVQADDKLVGRAVAHLLYYGCATVLDAFSFAASYAPTPELAVLVLQREVQREGVRYIVHGGQDWDDAGGGDGDGAGAGAGPGAGPGPGGIFGPAFPGSSNASDITIDGLKLVELYASLRQGQSLRAWCMERADVVRAIDVRRLITFGVIKGFLYRVHKYAYSVSVLAAGEDGDDADDGDGDNFNSNSNKASAGEDGNQRREQQQQQQQRQPDLRNCLDGTRAFDEICTMFGIGERELMRRLRAFGDVQIIHK